MSRAHNESRPDTNWYGVVVNRRELIDAIKAEQKRRKSKNVNPCRIMEKLMNWPEGTITNINQIDMKGSSSKDRSPDASLHLL